MREEFDDYQREEQQRSLLEAELAPGEAILWQGAPQGKIRTRSADLLRVFGLFWLGFSLCWELPILLALFSGYLMGIVYFLFGLPFVGVGIWLAFLRPYRQRREIESALYAVTDRRVIVLTTYPSRVVRSLPLKAVRSMEKRFRLDGRGELYFGVGSRAHGYEDGYDGGARRRGAVFAFYGVDADAAQCAMQQRLSALRKGADGNGA